MKAESLTIRIDGKVKQGAKRLAKAANISLTQLIEFALREAASTWKERITIAVAQPAAPRKVKK